MQPRTPKYLVDDSFVWTVIRNQLPKLRDEVDALLKEQGQHS